MKTPAFFMLTTGLLALADQAIKIWVRTQAVPQQVRPLVPNFLDFIWVENRGISFSFLSGLSEGIRAPVLVGISLLAMGFLGGYWFRHRHGMSGLGAVALSLILAGALGNLVDRALFGSVTDYLHFRFYSTSLFVNNAADIFISLGAVLFLADNWRAERKG
ncbi:MAG: signal peptidase II [Deltaproteobacteria bacterium]|nr:signal peptidase II [Deltaproteobacteria bacterium]